MEVEALESWSLSTRQLSIPNMWQTFCQSYQECCQRSDSAMLHFGNGKNLPVTISALPFTAQQHAIQTLISVFFVCFYQGISGFRNTKSNQVISDDSNDQIITTSPLKCSLRGEFLCGAVPQIVFLYITYIIYHPVIVKNLQQTIKVRLNLGWSTFDTWKLSPRLLPRCCVNSTKNKRGKGVVCACNKQSAAKAAVPGCSIALQKCCIMFSPQKQEQHATFQTSCSLKTLNHRMIQPFKNFTSYV